MSNHVAGASLVIQVVFPENADVKPRSIVVRPPSPAGELCSRVMAKCGLKGVGALSYKANADAAEVPLDRDEDVYRVAQQHGSAALLIFRPSGAAQEPLEGTLRLDDARTSDLGAQARRSQQPPPPPHTPAPITPSDIASEELARRLREQEKTILALRSKVAGLELIEKEQQRIIDAQERLPGAQPLPRASGTLNDEMEAERMRIALEQERQQRRYAEQELAQLRKQQEEMLRKQKRTGQLGDEFHAMEDDHPESAPGCNVGGASGCTLM